jgi:hypothetical protein
MQTRNMSTSPGARERGSPPGSTYACNRVGGAERAPDAIQLVMLRNTGVKLGNTAARSVQDMRSVRISARMWR